ncbi:GntR family transcriptional regulator [Cupriavidus sp. 8B]
MNTPKLLQTPEEQSSLLGELAFRRLEQMIVTSQLPPGTMVSEVQLANELGMGRTPVREALQRLKHIGFVEMHARRGTLVARSDVQQQLELLEVRRPMEELMVKLAAKRATDTQRGMLLQLADKFATAAANRSEEEYFLINRQVHEAEVQAAHNRTLEATMELILAQSRRFWYQHIQASEAYTEGAERHISVMRAIASGDSDAAAKASQAFLVFLEGLTRSVLHRFIR